MAKRTTKTTTLTNKTVAKAKRRRAAATSRGSKKKTGALTGFLVLLVFIAGIVFCLSFLGFLGYRTATASEFFNVRSIEVRGTSRSSAADIERIVQAQVEKTGVWNADLAEIKQKVERLPFVKTTAVARVLPDGVRVIVTERVPKAVVRLEGGDFWVDEEAVILSLVGKNEARPPFVMRGWDESKEVNANRDNRERVRIYQKLLEEWHSFNLSKRVREVNMADLQDLKAIVEDSGTPVPISLGNENFGKRLKTALEVVAGKGEQIKSVNATGLYPVIEYSSVKN